MAYIDEDLRKLKLRIQQEEEMYDPIVSTEFNNMSFDDFFVTNITDNLLKTMALEYDAISQTLKVQIIKDNMDNTKHQIYQYSMAPESYLSFCERALGLHRDATFNDSANKMINGVPVRIFAIMPPYKDYPLVVMSTAKRPPVKINHLSENDEAKLREVLQGNLLIAGKSGAGKTYLLNYLLSKYFPEDRRVGIIQEFAEIYSPNEFTDQITTPPMKPGQPWNDLQFLTEQSNLMRYDTIIVGEIRNQASWPLVVNMASGTKGIATIHGTSVQNALQRLRMMCLMAANNLNPEVVDSFIKDAVEYVVYVEDAQVTEIAKVLTVNHGKFAIENI